MITVLFGFCLAMQAQSDVFDAQVVPKAEDNFYEAGVRLWIPDQAARLEAILVILHGTDSDARSAVSQPEWQEFARRNHLALAGCYFRGDGEPYEDASGGSGKTLLDMLTEIARKSGRPELGKMPLLFVGHSAGAMFSYNFTCWKPESVLGFVSLKSGPIAPSTNHRAWSVPGLFIVGESDLAGRVRHTVEAYRSGAGKEGSRWTLAVEPGGGHGSSQAIRSLVQVYLEGVMSLRGGRVSGASSKTPINPGIIRKLDDPTREHPSGRVSSHTVWLPSETVAVAWQKFVKPVELDDLIKSGGQDDDEPAARLSVARLDFGDVDLRKGDSSFERAFLVSLPDLPDVSFSAADPSLRVVRNEKLSKKEYKVTLELDKSQLRPGHYRTLVTAVSSAGSSVEIPVSAKIAANYVARPSSMYVGVIARGSVSEMPIEILSDSGKPLKVGKIRSSRPEFAVARETGTGKLLCRFDGGRGLGNQSGYFDVVLEESPPRQLKIPFIAWVSKKEAL